ncbi:hypothetical protein ILYODFUR_020207 [Ilyodon furcidens]|uniref:Uncharacterized protein n=1 Tax=Ilyodon furcidens TaxID=33524 RepID=A0ABV0T1R9_9TELE
MLWSKPRMFNLKQMNGSLPGLCSCLQVFFQDCPIFNSIHRFINPTSFPKENRHGVFGVKCVVSFPPDTNRPKRFILLSPDCFLCPLHGQRYIVGPLAASLSAQPVTLEC